MDYRIRPLLGRQLTEAQKRLVFRAGRIVRHLDSIAMLEGTDKSSRGHGYTKHYESHLRGHRRQYRTVLEIGVGGVTSESGYEMTVGGQSLRMWRAYFPRAEIIGVDVNHKKVESSRITFRCGDQSDEQFLERLAHEFAPFDIIIDDGSHIGRHVRTTFSHLFSHLKPGGYYVIEDLEGAYREWGEGGPPNTPGTQAALLKDLVDVALGEFHQGYSPVASVHLYSEGIAFVKRSDM
jgi:hypothetical protein